MGVLEKNWVKKLILIGVPTIISSLGVFCAIFDFGIWVVYVVFVLLVVHVTFCVRYSNLEKDHNDELQRLAIQNKNYLKLNNCYAYSVSTVLGFEEMWAKNINRFADDVRDKGSVSNQYWNKQILYNQVCQRCRGAIEEYVGTKNDSRVSVGFIELLAEDEQKYVRFIAHSSSESARPSVYDKKQKLEDCRYYYAELIKSNFSDIEIAMDNNEIKQRFNNVNPGTSIEKYTQYVAIPVYCNNRKLLGVFQIVTKEGYIIMDDRQRMRNFAESFLIMYSNQILLIDKIRKGLYAKPL